MDHDISVSGGATKQRPLFQRAVEVVVSLAFLGIALRGISFADLWAALQRANYLWLLPAFALTAGILVVKGWRWRLLFLPEHRLPFGPVFSALCVGYLASNVLPARAGEAVRLVLLVSDQPVSVARTFSTIVIERLLDILSVLLLLVILLPFIAVELPAWMDRGAQLLGIGALAGAAMLILLSLWKQRLLDWAHRLLGRVRWLDRPGVYAALEHLLDGFATLRGRLGLRLLGVSWLGWAGSLGVAWCVARGFGLRVPLSAVAFALVVTTLGMLLPSTPGYIGVFHALVTVALAPFGVPKDLALSYALVWHATTYFSLSLAGALALWVHGISLGQVWRHRGDVHA